MRRSMSTYIESLGGHHRTFGFTFHSPHHNGPLCITPSPCEVFRADGVAYDTFFAQFGYS